MLYWSCSGVLIDTLTKLNFTEIKTLKILKVLVSSSKIIIAKIIEKRSIREVPEI